MTTSNPPQTLYDKLWDRRCIETFENGVSLLYVDRHIVHEVSSAQAFEGLREQNRKVWRPNSVIATPDHNVPTEGRDKGIDSIEDPVSKEQVEALNTNCEYFGLPLYGMNDPRHGSVHVIAPELALTLPGMVVVCGDSHTATHGAFAALGLGIGTSELEHVLATQCLLQRKATRMRITVNGLLSYGVSAKDMALYIIGQIGTAGGTGCAIEFCGSAVTNLSMEGRMTLCNMAIEAGARSGLVAFDHVTENYLVGRTFTPKADEWANALAVWRTLHSDEGATFDISYEFDASDIEPQITWGTSPEMVGGVSSEIPNLDMIATSKHQNHLQALAYMGLEQGQALTDIAVDKVFIGSCTNSRIEDLRIAASIVKGKRIASNVKQALAVPGSGAVKRRAEQEGLDRIFIDAGFEWREPGCSMCLGMNPDRIEAGEHCASTSNRNFEGRQGGGGRTHLVSPAMAAAASIAGHFVDFRKEEV